MSAYLLELDSDLQEMVMAEVLSLQEAWQMQDQMLLQQSEVLHLTEEFVPMLRRMQLFNLSAEGVRPQ